MSELRQPIAIVGMACRFPMADDRRTYWANVLNGRDCLGDIPATHWRPEDYHHADPKKPDMTYARRGGFLDAVAFDPLAYGIPPTALEATDTSQLLGMVTAREALLDAGYGAGREFNRDKVSVILGVTGALELVIPLGARLGHPIWRRALKEAGIPDDTAEAIVEKIAAGYVPWKEDSFPGLLGNVVAGRIANFLDLGGTNCAVDAACASAFSALHLACLELETRRAEMVLAGGVDTFNDIFMYMCFSKTPALSKSGDARPFDANSDGTMLGEGIGVVVLKRLDDAIRDGDRIHAIIRGLGSASDGKGTAVYAPVSKGQAKALRRAYADAGVEPRQIELVEAHGTGTKVGDATEIRALVEVYRGEQGTAAPAWCALGSVKSQIGHTKAAAGIAGLIKVALALDHKVLPPTAKVREPLDILREPNSPFFLLERAIPWLTRCDKRRAAVSAFGFGGSNFHLVLEETQSEKRETFWDGQVELIAFSGPHRGAIAEQLNAWNLEVGAKELARKAAASRASFQPGANCRLLIAHELGKSDLAHLRRQALALLEKYHDRAHWESPEGLFFGSGHFQGKLGVLFPGQGSQYPYMLADLACRFPEMMEALVLLDKHRAEFASVTGRTFAELLYPPRAFEAEARAEQEEQLRQTQIAQPAIGAASIGALRVLQRFGLRFQAAAGHSFGEITALCASGRLDAESFQALARLRGKLMAESEGDKGSMLAVRMGLHEMEKLIAEERFELVMANKNAPDQVVLSGTTAEIERAAQVLTRLGHSFKRLQVAAAFHSGLVAQAREPFHAELRKMRINRAEVPVYSNTTGRRYPEDEGEARALLAEQLIKPVEFVEEIRAMYADGVRVFLEVGPGARMTGLVKSILSGQDFEALALDSSSGKRAGTYDLARVLAQLSALGLELRLCDWEAGGPAAEPEQKRFTVAIGGANYVDPKTRQKAAAPIQAKLSKPLASPASQALAQPTEPPRTAAPASSARAASPVPLAPLAVTSLPSTSAAPASTPAPTRVAPVPDLNLTGNRQVMDQQTLAQALEIARQGMETLRKMQEQTADLHRKFLENQELAQRQVALVLERQRAALGLAPVGPSWEPSAVIPAFKLQEPAPAPVFAPVPAARAGLQQAAPLVVPPVSAHRPAPVAPLVQPPVTAPAAPAAASGFDSARISKALLDVVSEKTGYPVEMLNLEMQLDADLGIDSIKRVEILSGLHESLPELPAVEPERMGELVTLGAIVAYLRDKLALNAKDFSPVAAIAPSTKSGPVCERAELERVLLAVVSEKTGYPVEMLNLEMQLDADLGIDSIKRVEILSALHESLPQLPAIQAERMGELTTLAAIVAYLAAQAGAAEHLVSPQPTIQAEKAFAPAAPGLNRAHIVQALLAVVAEKTGYPVEMLAEHMQLDADLGIDSIKRVEILSALHEALPEMPAVEPERMGELTTLAAIADYLAAKAGSLAGTASETLAASAAVPAAVGHDRAQLAEALLSVVADKTGYPVEMLALHMQLDADLGIDSIKRVEILSALSEALPQLPPVEAERMGELTTLAAILDYWLALAPKAQLESPVTAPPRASQDAPRLSLEVLAPRHVSHAPNRGLDVRTPILVPLSGQRSTLQLGPAARVWVAGTDAPLVEAIAAEWRSQGVEAECVPLSEPGRELPPNLAGLILLAGAGKLDKLQLQNMLLLTRQAAPALRRNGQERAAFLLTASRLGGDFALSQVPSAEPHGGALAGLAKTAGHEWPEVFCKAIDLPVTCKPAADAALLVREALLQGPHELAVLPGGLFTLGLAPDLCRPARLLPPDAPVLVTGGARGVTAEVCIALAAHRPTLVLLGRSAPPKDEEPAWLAGLTSEAQVKKAVILHAESKLTPAQASQLAGEWLRGREIRANLAQMRAAGARVLYQQVDVRNSSALAACLSRVREAYGPIQGLIHGAGVLADRLIEDKTAEQFRAVYETKVDALENLLAELAPDPLRFIGLFSSSTARFGRKGQVDYAMANEVLNKFAQISSRQRSECRVVSFNWGPWDGGMVTPALRKIFEQEGVDLIPPHDGGQFCVDQLLSEPGGPVELVVLGPNGRAGDEPYERDSSLHPAFDLQLSVDELPVLRAHVLNGKAVLPFAFYIEWMAQAAMTEHPGLKFQGIRNPRLFKGIALAADESLQLKFFTGEGQREEGGFCIPVEVRSSNGRDYLHARGEVVLVERLPAPKLEVVPVPEQSYGKTPEEIYQLLFHGPQLQGIREVETYSEQGLSAQVAAAPSPKAWLKKPLRAAWICDPMVIDGAFQLMVLWCMERYGIPGLPNKLASLRLYAPFPAEGVKIRIQITAANPNQVRAEMSILDERDKLIASIEGYECTMIPSLNQAFRQNHLETAVTQV